MLPAWMCGFFSGTLKHVNFMLASAFVDESLCFLKCRTGGCLGISGVGLFFNLLFIMAYNGKSHALK